MLAVLHLPICRHSNSHGEGIELPLSCGIERERKRSHLNTELPGLERNQIIFKSVRGIFQGSS